MNLISTIKGRGDLAIGNSAKKGNASSVATGGATAGLGQMPGENPVPMGWTMIVMSFVGGLVLLSLGGQSDI